MKITLICRKCDDAWLQTQEKKEVLPGQTAPGYVYDWTYDFDETKSYRCTGCGHVMTLEVEG